AQLNRVFDYGSKGYRFESCWGHKRGSEIFRSLSCDSRFAPNSGLNCTLQHAPRNTSHLAPRNKHHATSTT
ncbi:MAG TPA: hypothetical protein PK738_02780, partial [Bacteroidales bacterium]|nr:hypothetical protein [Bacteroidales bacterium]